MPESPSQSELLPEFKTPPVVEAAFSVEFLPIPGWTSTHVGLFWSEVKRDYPRSEVKPPILSAIEKFGENAYVPTAPNFEIVQGEFIPSRTWLISDERGRLLQLQRDRFIHNWRKTATDNEYPRYEDTRSMFRQEWERFRKFLSSVELPNPEVLQCELTYVNHIDKGMGWETLDDLPGVTTFVSGVRGERLPTPEIAVVNLRYVIPDQKGRLHILLQPALRNVDQTEILQLQLVARGSPGGNDTDSLLTWFDLGHDWITRGFLDFTTERMQAHWGRTR